MDNYTDLELVGKGSYGKVFKATCTEDYETYVVKKVAFDGNSQAEADATVREAHVLSLLRHPHVVPYKEFFKHPDGDLCLVMAYCEGGDLYKYVRELRKVGKSVPEKQVWEWLVQLLLSLSYIHSKRILHRDVKTQNIFLSQGKLLLGDFGLAKQLQRTYEMAKTPIGTPYYMAPEIYEEKPYSFKSDVWALGCVMYELLTGKPAFAADSLSRVVLRVIRGTYDPMPETYSRVLREVITIMLARDLATRPSASELLTHAAVVPYVQAYLESLSAEGPKGWATWRMKLPMAALAQMAGVLEAAGVAVPSSRPQSASAASTSALSRPGSAQSRPGTAAASGVGAGRGGNQQQVLCQAVEDKLSGTALMEHYDMGSLLADAGGGGKGVGAGVRPPSAKQQQGSVPATPPSGYNESLQRRPGKLPPIRTPYGLATPFMGNVIGAAIGSEGAGKYAELQVIAQQVLHIRTSQTGEAGDTPAPAPAATAAMGDGAVRKLDAALRTSLNLTSRAVLGDAPGGSPQQAAGGGNGAGQNDLAWLTSALPQGSFGKDGAGAAVQAGAAAAGRFGAAAAGAAAKQGAGRADRQGSFEFTDLAALLPLPSLGTHQRQHQTHRNASSSSPQEGPETPTARPRTAAAKRPTTASTSTSSPAASTPVQPLCAADGIGGVGEQQRASPSTPSPLPARPAAASRSNSRTSNGSGGGGSVSGADEESWPQGHDGDDTIELISLQQVSLQECLTTRRSNLAAFCGEQLGHALAARVLAAVREVAAATGRNGAIAAAAAADDTEAALRSRLAGLVPEHKLAPLLPMLDELAFLEARATRAY